MDPLITSLLDLLFELREQGPSLTVGGGFGLFLKRLNLAETGDRTLLARLPEARATNDLDLFIRAEILADLDRTRQIAEAIRSLRYEPVLEGPRPFQHLARLGERPWSTPLPGGNTVENALAFGMNLSYLSF
jgi:hypothetical protein